MRRRILIIANPVSGTGKARRLARAVVDQLRRSGCEVEVRETLQAGDARRHAGDVRGWSAVACVGGDGTINELLNGLPEGEVPPIGMIPSGTANVLAKELGLPGAVEGLARVLTEGREIRWDLGLERVAGRKLLLFASTGYDAHVVHVFHSARRGPIRMWQYVLWGLRSILRFRVPRITVELDGKALPAAASWVQISNVASYGGPLVFTPHARPDDGRFEVMVQRARRRRDILRMFWAALVHYVLGVQIHMVDVTFHHARRVKLEAPDGRRVPVQIDGDPAGNLPIDVEVLPGGIRVLGP